MPELWDQLAQQQIAEPVSLWSNGDRAPLRITVGGPTMRDGGQAPGYSLDPFNPPPVEYVGKPLAKALAYTLEHINNLGRGFVGASQQYSGEQFPEQAKARTGEYPTMSTDFEPVQQAVSTMDPLIANLWGVGSVSVPHGAAGALGSKLIRNDLPVKGAAYTKESRKVLDEIASGPKGAGPMVLTGDLRSDVPQTAMERYVPKRGVSPRLQDALANPAVERGVSESIETGLGLGADKWYHNEPVRQAFIKELGPTEGPKEFARFMDMIAATSPRSDVPTNIRNASYYYGRGDDGLPKKLPYPYGHVAQNLHRQNYETLTAPRPGALSADTPGAFSLWDIFKNPKPASFSQNLQGNLIPGTMDTHAFRNIGMRTEDPRFLETSISAKYKQGTDPTKDTIVNKYGERKGDKVTFRPQRLHEAGKLSLDEALDIPYFWASKPNENEYAAAEQFYSRLGRDFRLPTADAQAAAWAGGGKLTGLGTVPTHTFPELLNERVLFTAKMRGEDPQTTLAKFIKQEAPLYANATDKKTGAAVLAATNANAVRAANPGIHNGRPFWSGAFDPLDGHIIETHPYEKAANSDFHHSFYFSDKAQQSMKEGRAQFFWLDKDGSIQTQWRNAAANPKIIQAIRDQLGKK